MSAPIQDLIKDIQANITTFPLSVLLSKTVILAQELSLSDLEEWAKLEINGYLRSNPAMNEQVKVPEYRTVVGEYFDDWDRPLQIQNPELMFIMEYRLRQSVVELEGLLSAGKMITIKDLNMTALIRDHLSVEVSKFVFPTSAIHGVLEGIRTQLIDKIRKVAIQHNTREEGLTSELTVSGFHPRVIQVAGKLFENGHYRQAILDTYISLVEQVKAKSGRYDIDGSPLMQNVFSSKNPKIVVSDDSDEQMGFMWLFTGAVMAIRNPKAHRLDEIKDPQVALEWLGFASALFKKLDESTVK